ncbi:MAG TPA: hypothetical protein VFE78_34305 [Gemmataceae bacterium]|jgi:hypothetical protein|nr:hypothetical protein [Gemmataceae bacterium]
MRRLRSGPRDVLAEHGVEAPEGVEVVEGDEVKVEDAEAVRRFTFTVNPPDELAEEDLVGGAVAWCFSGACAACAACGRCACRCSCRCF